MMSNKNEEKKIQEIKNPEKVDFSWENIILSHIEPHNLAEYLNKIGKIEWEVETDKNEIKKISEKLDLHIENLEDDIKDLKDVVKKFFIK